MQILRRADPGRGGVLPGFEDLLHQGTRTMPDGIYVTDRTLCMNLHHMRKDNKECDTCEWFNHCCGGCRALAIFYAGKQNGKYDYTAPDPIACLFFKGGWYEKVKGRLGDLAHGN